MNNTRKRRQKERKKKSAQEKSGQMRLSSAMGIGRI